MELLNSARTPIALASGLSYLKAQTIFGESLCYSQLHEIESVLEEAEEIGWGFEDELSNVRNEIRVLDDVRMRHYRMRTYNRDLLLSRTLLRGVKSIILEFLFRSEPRSRRAAPGPYTLLERFRAPGTGKVWLWAPYTAEAWESDKS